MKWKTIDQLGQLDQIEAESWNKSILIFKHSTRCSISDTILNRFERDWKDDYNLKIMPYYLDLIKYRVISNEIANRYGIEHQSPQILLISDGKCIYTQSHNAIQIPEIIGCI